MYVEYFIWYIRLTDFFMAVILSQRFYFNKNEDIVLDKRFNTTNKFYDKRTVSVIFSSYFFFFGLSNACFCLFLY